MTEILAYCTEWRTLTDITANIQADRDVGTLVGEMLRTGLLERRETKKRGAGGRFGYTLFEYKVAS